MADYEIELVRAQPGAGDNLELVATLTGYPLEEIRAKAEPQLLKCSGWYGRDFIATFRALGFNCSQRFVPFDHNTDYPCLMRYQPTKRQMVREGIKHPWWNVMVYYRGRVYDPHYGIYAMHRTDAAALGLPEWWNHEAYRVTSMIQVWMGEEPVRVLR